MSTSVLPPQAITSVFQSQPPRVWNRGMTDANTESALLLPDVTVREEHSDTMTITDHPVEKGTGAYVSDHAYKLPAEVTLEYAWSPTGPGNRTGASTYIHDIYDKVINLQEARTLVNIYTGKRAYKNMLILEVALTTDLYTENALMLRIGCREILLVETQILQVSLDPAHQMFPDRTMPEQNRGVQSLQYGNLMNQQEYQQACGPII
jgi:hypothetical protein